QVVDAHAQLLRDLLLRLIDAQLRLGAGDVALVGAGGELGDAAGRGVRLVARGLQRPLDDAAGGRVLGAVRGGAPQRHPHLLGQFAGDLGDSRRQQPRLLAADLRRLVAGAGLAFGAGLAAQPVGLAADAARTLLSGAQGQAGLGLHGAGLGQGDGGAVALLRRRLPLGRVLVDAGQAVADLVEFAAQLHHAGVRVGAAGGGALRIMDDAGELGLGAGAGVGKLLEGALVVAVGGAGGRGVRAAILLLGGGARQDAGQVRQLLAGGGQFGFGGGDVGADLDARLGAAAAAGHPARAVQAAVGGRGAQAVVLVDDAARRGG